MNALHPLHRWVGDCFPFSPPLHHRKFSPDLNQSSNRDKDQNPDQDRTGTQGTQGPGPR